MSQPFKNKTIFVTGTAGGIGGAAALAFAAAGGRVTIADRDDDCAFNNAGVALEDANTDWGTAALSDRTMAVNVNGILNCMRAELRHMTPRRSGAIVNTASIAGESGAGGAGYCGSKHAVIGLVRSAALRYAAEGIRVNAVCPGGHRHADDRRHGGRPQNGGDHRADAADGPDGPA